MSWFRRNKPTEESSTADPKTTPSKKNRVQVPSSSPITINSSPTKESTIQQPSLASKLISNEKERELELKRQKIRQHKDFPLIRKKFNYLSESDILKAFVKCKGNARDINKYLETNFDRNEYLRKENEQRQKIIQQQEEMREKNRQLRFQQLVEQTSKSSTPEVERGIITDDVNGYDEEDESPVKIKKGRATVKIDDMSPTKPNARESTKVSVKSKKSISDKYNRQSTLDKYARQFKPDQTSRLESLPKKRRLVRLSSLEDSSTPSSRSISPIPAPVGLAARFSYRESNTPNPPLDQPDVIEIGDTEEEAEPEDELEMLERKILENRKKRRQNQVQQPKQDKQNQRKPSSTKAIINLSDDENEDIEELLDDDEEDGDSDSLDEAEDDEMDTGYTSIDQKVLEFINSAPIEDLSDICGIEPSVAEIVISQRPFHSLDVIAENDFPLTDADAAKSKRKKKKLGLKMIETTEGNLKGYKAVDSLIKQCAEYGDRLTEQMKSWGVSLTTEQGELDMVDLDPIEEQEVVDLDKEDDDFDEDIIMVKKRYLTMKYIKDKPALLADDVTLNNYQQVGINWLNLLYQNKLSCILADEMGLGKTCQVIAFMAHLKQVGERGPHLVVVPASTIENWLREFNKFCPDLLVRAYYGSQAEREELRYELLNDDEFEVLVTTYTLACGSPADAKFLKSQNFNVIVYDEGHLLKNSTSERYNKLMRLKGNFRLLLTGTPLQNNLKELVSLLSFMLPQLFNEKREELSSIFNQKSGTVTKENDHNPLLAQQAIKNAKTMMAPFVLRRRKDQVLQHLPPKTLQVVHCTMTKDQKRLYLDHFNNGKYVSSERQRRRTLPPETVAKLNREDPIPTSSNVLMELRKAALHPLLFRVIFDDSKLQEMSKAIMMEPEYATANQTYIFEDMQVMSDFELDRLCTQFPKTLSKWKLGDEKFLDSGKVIELGKILQHIIDNKEEKVLIFSLFTQVLDILERVLSIFNYKFARLDGNTPVQERQDLIDLFNQDDKIHIFLISTKAGGVGINLVAANHVIMFDQSFNPHEDKQAEDRAHRVGQTKEVKVYRLISDETIEKNIFSVARNKLELDEKISTLESIVYS